MTEIEEGERESGDTGTGRESGDTGTWREGRGEEGRGGKG